MDNQALGFACFSYDGRIHCGFAADYDGVPDLDTFPGRIREELDVLRSLARRPATGGGGDRLPEDEQPLEIPEGVEPPFARVPRGTGRGLARARVA